MSKRKRASSKPANGESIDESSDDTAVKDDMVHVTPDLLAGSPDIFASKKPDVSTDPIEPTAASTTLTSEAEPEREPEPAPEAEPAPPPPPAPTHAPTPYVEARPYTPARTRRGGSSVLGIVFVVVGLFALLVVLTGTDLTQYGWPLFIIIPGLTLLVAGFVSVGAGATIPGGVLSTLGVVLAYCNSNGKWAFLAYGWSLVVPGGVGLGVYLQALRDRDQAELRTGRTLMFVALMIFLIGFTIFESIIGISGRNYYAPYSNVALPVLMVIVGLILLVRSIQRNRRV